MATYDFNSLFIYDAGTGERFNIPGAELETGTVDDGETDRTFEVGADADTFVGVFSSPFTGAPFSVTGSFAGSLVFDGETLPVGFLPFSAFPPELANIPGAPAAGVYVVADFRTSFDRNIPTSINVSDINVADFTVCFLTGTTIATPTGQHTVETLQIGDDILTADGETVPVKWIGKQTVFTAFRPAERLRPVRVTAGALGNGLPYRDLLLTQDHALLIDGLLVNAGALVNGSTIVTEPLDEFNGSYTVYHVETEGHDVILAEGAAAETYIDYTTRRSFDNYAEYVDLYGKDRTIPEMAVPRISSARMLPDALKSRLGLSAAA